MDPLEGATGPRPVEQSSVVAQPAGRHNKGAICQEISLVGFLCLFSADLGRRPDRPRLAFFIILLFLKCSHITLYQPRYVAP